MKLNERMKRRLAVLGCVVVGAVLIAAIGSQFKGEAQGSNQTEARTEQTEAVTVAVIPTETTEAKTEEETEPTKSDIIVRTEPATEPSRTGTTEPSADLPAQTDGTGRAAGSGKTNCSPRRGVKESCPKAGWRICRRNSGGHTP